MKQKTGQRFSPISIAISLVVFALFFASSSCTPKISKKSSQKPPLDKPTDITVKADTFPIADIEVVAPDPVDPVPHIIVRIEKTACFGYCPILEVKLFSDGRAQYHGKANIDRLGLYEAFANEAFISDINNRVNRAKYFALADAYPINGKYLSDLPNTISYFNIGKKDKSIIRNHNGPLELRKLEDYVLERFEQLEWIRID